MGYAHIENLYKYPDIFLLREVYALEKIHGASTRISWSAKGRGDLHFSAGGEKHERFIAIFNEADLADRMKALAQPKIAVFGEAYGGKSQGMSRTYGDALKFVAFDVKIGDSWLSVPDADFVAQQLGLEFVGYTRIPATIEAMNVERDRPSEQAARNGIAEPQAREGVVIRPLIELSKNDGSRIICKHKNASFSETRTAREVDPAKLQVLTDANEIAAEWVTPMRLTHVLQKITAQDESATGAVIKAMIEDVQRESTGEVIWSRDVERAIGCTTAKLFKGRLTDARERLGFA